jgi:putative ABC transport system permease protein
LILFLLKGLLRDRTRSLFPCLVVTAGVMLTVVLHSYIKGSENDIVQASASLVSGHVDVVSRAYAREEDQVPNDLALLDLEALLGELRRAWPDLVWTPRIRFAGLLDVPDAEGETRAQGSTVGLAVDLLDPDSPEHEVLDLTDALVAGRLPAAPGEVLLSEVFAGRLGVALDETVTLIGATMHGSLATANFTVVGTVRFGVSAVDRGALLADVGDIQAALDMQDGAGEVLGFFPDLVYRPDRARAIADAFNARHVASPDPYAPLMRTLRDHDGLAETLDLANAVGAAVVSLFVLVMSIVLWNAGLMGSLRRFGEFGVRLAIGENRMHLYRSLLIESLAIGLAGSLLGTALGLAAATYLQVHGMDISGLLRNSAMMISDVLRARVTPASWVIGFVPGILATFLGAAISGLGIFRRRTADLTKELQT